MAEGNFGPNKAIQGVEARLNRLAKKGKEADNAERARVQEELARGRGVSYIHTTFKSMQDEIGSRIKAEDDKENKGGTAEVIDLDVVLLDDDAVKNLRGLEPSLRSAPTNELARAAYEQYKEQKEISKREAPKFGKVKNGSKIRNEIAAAQTFVDMFEGEKSTVYTEHSRAHASDATRQIKEMANQNGFELELSNEGPFIRAKIVPMNQQQLEAYAYRVAQAHAAGEAVDTPQEFTAEDIERVKAEAIAGHEAKKAEGRELADLRAENEKLRTEKGAMEAAAREDEQRHKDAVALVIQIMAAKGTSAGDSELLKRLLETVEAKRPNGSAE